MNDHATGGELDSRELLSLACDVLRMEAESVLASVEKTSRCLVVHEDSLTAGFGAEIAATLASAAFWYLDAPVERLAVDDVPMPYHPVLLDAVLPSAGQIADRIEALLQQ